jgi:hypothetical protein
MSRIYKGLKKLNTKIANNPVIKWANELNRHFSNVTGQVIEKWLKKCSTLLVIKEM